MKRIAIALAGLSIVFSSCAQQKQISMTVGKLPPTVRGNVVTIPISVRGIRIVKPDGDTSGKTGHFHIFIDRRPVGVGDVIPKTRGVVHTAEEPIKIYGLRPGNHRFRIVLGDGTHRRIGKDVARGVRVDVEGPGVQAFAPATIRKGQNLVVRLQSEGVKIVEPGAESAKNEAHYHVLVDPSSPPKAGETIEDQDEDHSGHASGDASMEGATYMTGDSSVTIPSLTLGEHTIWVVLSNKAHEVWKPAVMDKLTVTVT